MKNKKGLIIVGVLLVCSFLIYTKTKTYNTTDDITNQKLMDLTTEYAKEVSIFNENRGGVVLKPKIEIIDNDFKKYTNKDLNISFIFPISFNILENFFEADQYIVVNGAESKNPDENIYNSLKIKIFETNNYDFLIKTIDYNNLYNLDGKTFIEYQDVYSGDIVQIVFIKREKDVVQISYFKNSKYSHFYDEIVKNIIY